MGIADHTWDSLSSKVSIVLYDFVQTSRDVYAKNDTNPVFKIVICHLHTPGKSPLEVGVMLDFPFRNVT